MVQKRETKAINKLCVREILSLSFVCGAYFFEFRGRNLVCFGIAYNFDWGRHMQIRAGSRDTRMRTAFFTRVSSTTTPARIYSCLLRCDILIELSKEHRCVVRHCHVYGQTNKQHISVCSLLPAQHCSNQ